MTAGFILLFCNAVCRASDPFEYREEGIVRGPKSEKKIALEFTADQYVEGGCFILDQLNQRHIKGSFFLTGRCVRNPANRELITRIVNGGHYLGPHSETHPLLCPWEGPKKTLVTKEFFLSDITSNLTAIEAFGVKRSQIEYLIPPYEHYNSEIVGWTRELGMQLINFSPGTRSTADYTEADAKNYVSSQVIFDSIVREEKEHGLNGFLLLVHMGVSPKRADKFYSRLGELTDYLQGRGYAFVRVDDLLVSSAASRPCFFNRSTLEFEGTPLQQAICLLRPVRRGGVLGEPLAALPEPLESLIGQPMEIRGEALQNYLNTHQISEMEIGGPLVNSVGAKYFVIHDVSAPNYRERPFPPNINDASWKQNNLERWKKTPVAHIFVNRLGQSVTAHQFAEPHRATKLEMKVLGEKGKGLFVHTELVQPRRSDPNARSGNDAIAPEPGFTLAQYDRLALLYVAASFEHGQWMVPAYHSAIDAGIRDAHDDPQNFDLSLWADRLGLLLNELKTAN